MANKRISALDDITVVGGTSTPEVNANDILPITDVDDTTGSPQGTTKGVKVSDLMGESPVQSVAGRTGAVTLSNTDVSGLGTASTQDVGIANGNVVQLDATGLPAVDGSQLTNVSGTDSTKLAIANNLSDLNNAATARSNLGVDAAGTDNSTDVSLDTASHDYLSLTGQTIALGAIDLSTDVTGLLPNTSVSGLGTAATTASTDYATSAQGALADSAQQPPTEGAFVDGDKTKLDGIEALADVTDATNVEAAGALMDSEVTNLAQVKAFDSANYATAAHTHAINDLSDVDTSTVAPTTNDFLKWGGSNWVPAVPTADVDTPLTTALRGTDNPHIGAFPEQSFKVMDNPNKSAMVIADADGNITYILKDSAAEVRVAKGVSGTPSRFALASDLPAFVLENDTGEPDIEVTEPTSGEKISVISGDSDAKGANGLPARQGYNLPDIGGNPAPILISGGSIA